MGLAHACAEGAALRGWRLRAVEWFDYLDFVAEPLPFDEGVWHPPPNTGFDVKQSPGCFFVAVVRRLRPVFLLGCVLHPRHRTTSMVVLFALGLCRTSLDRRHQAQPICQQYRQ